MSYSAVLAVVPDQRPITLLELRNGHGWSPSIWKRLLRANGLDDSWRWLAADDFGDLDKLWKGIEQLPEWQQAPLVLTFDTGVIPCTAFEWAADQLDEFERRLPSDPQHVNHVPAVAELLRTKPETPLIGVYGTSVSENPFDPWDGEADEPGHGIPLGQMYVLERHRQSVIETLVVNH